MALAGDVPREVEVNEHGVRYLAAPWEGQKTGAFLDQRENRVLIGALARGRALDCFAYHGSFALHLAKRAERVTALDTSSAALARARANAERNALTNIDFVEQDAFEFLRAQEKSRARYDTIVLDPPAFAKSRSALPAAIRGYKEINLRGMRLLERGGLMFTASCSFHSVEGRIPRDARERRCGFGATHDSSRDPRTTPGPSGSAHDPRDRISQGSHRRSDGLNDRISNHVNHVNPVRTAFDRIHMIDR